MDPDICKVLARATRVRIYALDAGGVRYEHDSYESFAVPRTGDTVILSNYPVGSNAQTLLRVTEVIWSRARPFPQYPGAPEREAYLHVDL